MDYYQNINKKDYVKDYIDRSILIGKDVQLIESNNTIPATVLSIDDDCRLKVQLENGSERWLTSGEVSIKLHN
ncbi:MAG: hypothetical protein ACLT2Z_01405 [Eubacterium sp.]